MRICVTLLLVFIGSASALKQGDFGIFSACLTKNSSLRLNCYYAHCPSSPSFYCEFKTPNGSLLAKASNKMCSHTLQDHFLRYGNNTTNYNCTLMRNNRKEEKYITIDYSKQTGKKRFKLCRDTTGLLLHQAPVLLWPVVMLSLCRVLIADCQTT